MILILGWALMILVDIEELHKLTLSSDRRFNSDFSLTSWMQLISISTKPSVLGPKSCCFLFSELAGVRWVGRHRINNGSGSWAKQAGLRTQSFLARELNIVICHGTYMRGGQNPYSIQGPSHEVFLLLGLVHPYMIST